MFLKWGGVWCVRSSAGKVSLKRWLRSDQTCMYGTRKLSAIGIGVSTTFAAYKSLNRKPLDYFTKMKCQSTKLSNVYFYSINTILNLHVLVKTDEIKLQTSHLKTHVTSTNAVVSKNRPAVKT